MTSRSIIDIFIVIFQLFIPLSGFISANFACWLLNRFWRSRCKWSRHFVSQNLHFTYFDIFDNFVQICVARDGRNRILVIYFICILVLQLALDIVGSWQIEHRDHADVSAGLGALAKIQEPVA